MQSEDNITAESSKVSKNSDDEFVEETITNETISKIDPSFWDDYEKLDLNEERLNRYANELSSESTSKFTSTSTNTNGREDGSSRSKKRKVIVDRRERAISDALANINRSKDVDLCYVLDCTSSMSGHIAAAKDCILQVTKHIKDINPSIKIRVGFCGYRDHCDSTRIQIIDFTNSYEKFRKSLTKVPATGGGDPPEDVLGGLNAAITQLSWHEGTRVLLHVGDYPPHGLRFSSMQDNYPNGDPYGLTAESVLEKMRSERILYFFGKITGYTDEMIRIFRSIIGEFPVFDLVGGDPIQLINKFIKATTASITTSVSLTSTIGCRTSDLYTLRRRLEVNPDVPNWETLPLQTGVTLSYYIPKTLGALKNQRSFRKEQLFSRKFNFKIALQPFSAGIEKYAYYAVKMINDNPPKQMVMKQYFKSASVNPFEKYLESVEISAVTSYLSKRFNTVAKRKEICPVNFLGVDLVRVAMPGGTQYYTVEPELQDAKFKRFNTNSGIIVDFQPTLEAFAHFTYEHTRGYLVVCDLQGVEMSGEFLLTDPAIHCTDNLRFGRTNLGREGIEKCFLANHECNEICKKLRLKIRSK
ncbi:kinase-like protein [Gigaspora margarita]|uniref:Kinase-like protein n=1 Tax=Gigaspora margarita TaxID=4874 RepID=A0A8H4EJA5_GIGMA|nr:kinase-like protein [Gigaspora margarita]